MDTLLEDIPFESIPECLGGGFKLYNEPYEFDLSESGPLFTPPYKLDAEGNATIDPSANEGIVIDHKAKEEDPSTRNSSEEELITTSNSDLDLKVKPSTALSAVVEFISIVLNKLIRHLFRLGSDIVHEVKSNPWIATVSVALLIYLVFVRSVNVLCFVALPFLVVVCFRETQ